SVNGPLGAFFGPGAACTSACTSQPTDCANRLPFLPPARRALARLSGSNLATSGARASKASFTCAASPVLSVDTKPCANISSATPSSPESPKIQCRSGSPSCLNTALRPQCSPWAANGSNAIQGRPDLQKKRVPFFLFDPA